MNQSPVVYQKDLVLVGGGHSHAQVMKMFPMKGPSDVKVTVVCDSSTAIYSGMLPGCIAGLYKPEEIQMELRALAEWAGIRFILARVTGIDPLRKEIQCEGRPPIRYDVLSVNVGSTTRGVEDIPGAREYALATRPINLLLNKLEAFESAHKNWNAPPRIVVVGAGAAGTELSFGLYERFRRSAASVDVTLVDANDELLPNNNAMFRQKVKATLDAKGIRLKNGARAQRVEQGKLVLQGDEIVKFDLLMWATGGAAPPLAAQSNLKTNEHGFIQVKQTLQTETSDDVFATGDCIDFAGQDLPKAGVYAVRQGPVLMRNLIHRLMDEPLEKYEPQTDFLALLMTGDGEGIASRNGLGLKGRWVWKLKDYIDQKWMTKFDPGELGMRPENSFKLRADQPEDVMRCSGCAAKVGATILDESLKALEFVPNARVKIGLGSSDDAAVTEVPAGKLVVQTVDYFRAFLDDPYLLGRIITVHSASDIYAMGATPDTALVIATLPHTARERQARELRQLMTGINEEAFRMNVSIIGGHTSEGADMSIGLVVNGLVEESGLSRKGGLKPGDQLILTKRLGTGTLLAAHMRLRTKGKWIDEALQHMLQCNGPASQIFLNNDIQSMTDITGFGLAGHLVEMLEPSNAGAVIHLDRLPLLPGALESMENGVLSTLAPENRERLCRWEVSENQKVLGNILHDPQTSGGLIAGVKPESVETVLEQLRQAGYVHATVIGEVTEHAMKLQVKQASG